MGGLYSFLLDLGTGAKLRADAAIFDQDLRGGGGPRRYQKMGPRAPDAVTTPESERNKTFTSPFVDFFYEQVHEPSPTHTPIILSVTGFAIGSAIHHWVDNIKCLWSVPYTCHQINTQWAQDILPAGFLVYFIYCSTLYLKLSKTVLYSAQRHSRCVQIYTPTTHINSQNFSSAAESSLALLFNQHPSHPQKPSLIWLQKLPYFYIYFKALCCSQCHTCKNQSHSECTMDAENCVFLSPSSALVMPPERCFVSQFLFGFFPVFFFHNYDKQLILNPLLN